MATGVAKIKATKLMLTHVHPQQPNYKFRLGQLCARGYALTTGVRVD